MECMVGELKTGNPMVEILLGIRSLENVNAIVSL